MKWPERARSLFLAPGGGPSADAGRVQVMLYDPTEPGRDNLLSLSVSDAEFLGNQLISVAHTVRERAEQGR